MKNDGRCDDDRNNGSEMISVIDQRTVMAMIYEDGVDKR
jgi:hypothetical protein